VISTANHFAMGEEKEKKGEKGKEGKKMREGE